MTLPHSHEPLNDGDMNLTPEQENTLPREFSAERLIATLERARHEREPHCRECTAWFLGCLNGRETWKDKAIRPNFRNVTLRDGYIGGLCDAFQLDPNPNRHGRLVYDDADRIDT